MPKQSPRIDPRLVAAIRQLDDVTESIAATNRRVGLAAEHLEVVRPSYEQVRVLVHAERRRVAERRASRELMQDVLLGRRSPSALNEPLG